MSTADTEGLATIRGGTALYRPLCRRGRTLSIPRFTFALLFQPPLYFLTNFPRREIDAERLQLQGCFGGRGCNVTLLTCHSPHSQVPFMPLMVVSSTSAASPCSIITQFQHVTEVRTCRHVYGSCEKKLNGFLMRDSV